MPGRARLLLVLGLVVALAAAASLWLYWQSLHERVLVVFHAGSLTEPFELLAHEFEARYGVEVHLEAYGSVAAVRQVVELGRYCDVIAVADYRLIPELMWPEHADWCLVFASNEMVLAYTPESAYADETGPDNWFDVICRKGVWVGRSDPAQDPCGYRALLVLKLAELYYGREAEGLYERFLAKQEQLIRPKSHDLVALLQADRLDYAFLYKSVAVQSGLRFVDLPPEVDLGHPEHAELYARVSVEVEGLGEVVGAPIAYGITVPKCARERELALRFLELLLGDTGASILKECGQNAIRPARALGYERLPEELKPYVVAWEA